MKSKTKILVTLGIISSFAIGFIAGVSTEYPKPQSTEGITGTIAKVKKYKNTKATEQDIQLRDQLVQNEEQLAALKSLLTIYYTNAILRSNLIDQVVAESSKNETLNSKLTMNLAELNSYSNFLDNSRADLLVAMDALEKINENNPALVRSSINQAVNIITQVRYRNVAVLDFLDQLNLYIEQNPDTAAQELKDSFNQLALNEFKNAIFTKDAKNAKLISAYNIDSETNMANINEEAKAMAKKDMEQLGTGFTDSEVLGVINAIYDSEKLGLKMIETLAVFANSENLGGFFDSENLSGFFDSEKLGAGFTSNASLNFVSDSEALAGIFAFDSESLNDLSSLIN